VVARKQKYLFATGVMARDGLTETYCESTERKKAYEAKLGHAVTPCEMLLRTRSFPHTEIPACNDPSPALPSGSPVVREFVPGCPLPCRETAYRLAETRSDFVSLPRELPRSAQAKHACGIRCML